MRSSIAAQSCASVPPAPAWMSRNALCESILPGNMRWNSSRSHLGGEARRIGFDLAGGLEIALFRGHLQELARVAQAARQLIETVDDLFELGAFLAELLRPIRVVPDAGLLELAGYFLQALVLVVVIKDTSSRSRCAPRDL